jgi:hypothetical protein
MHKLPACAFPELRAFRDPDEVNKMRIVRVAVTAFGLLGFCSLATGQSSPLPDPSELSERYVRDHLRPKLVMQDALSRAEKFMADEKIDATHFWLYSARYTLFGPPKTPDKDKLVGWYFWWVSDTVEMGNYIEIFVTMDGECRRLGSM